MDAISGINSFSGSSRPRRPCSTSCIAATEAIAFVMEKILKILSSLTVPASPHTDGPNALNSISPSAVTFPIIAAGRVLFSKYVVSVDDTFTLSVSFSSDLQPANTETIITDNSSFFMFFYDCFDGLFTGFCYHYCYGNYADFTSGFFRVPLKIMRIKWINWGLYQRISIRKFR